MQHYLYRMSLIVYLTSSNTYSPYYTSSPLHLLHLPLHFILYIRKIEIPHFYTIQYKIVNSKIYLSYTLNHIVQTHNYVRNYEKYVYSTFNKCLVYKYCFFLIIIIIKCLVYIYCCINCFWF